MKGAGGRRAREIERVDRKEGAGDSGFEGGWLLA